MTVILLYYTEREKEKTSEYNVNQTKNERVFPNFTDFDINNENIYETFN